ncbi:penicillin-binding protein 1C [Stagnimonas aquatica]|uniref:peptidoglycan glycosyltransferase n=1 Tax=Stagnimonas aquatica TaxID=2689987 RepID=A0A3N0VH05_9GAMM|nr:penicillin-binding protein 1C [Stagnimonas aquatica]ROH92049.1 penicillin-binding protein 1C [Stagnimonas aquatica]
MSRARLAALSLLALAALLLIVRLWPRPPLAARIPLSTAVLDSRGELLRLRLASDGQLRLWQPLSDMPPALIEAVLLHEDRHFYWHPGVNPPALLRAALVTASGGARQGGSTLSMQLARLLERRHTRNLAGKLGQIGAALWLEARYSKREILEAYLNLAPYGGNVQGVGAAARLYFGKRPRELDLAQTLALAVLPQAPNARVPGTGETESLRAARLRLYARWLAVHPAAAEQRALVEAPLRFQRRALPFRAPHFTGALLAEAGETAPAELKTTLDLRLQSLLEQRLRQHLAPLARVGIDNAAVLLVDSRDLGVRAWIGSADWFNAGIHGQVDGVSARRSPGSTLKPLLYALAMDQGLIHPLSVLKDAPTYFGPYAPENNDGAFLGPISAHDALIRSRNVPAVQLSAQLREPSLYRFLKSAGVALPRSERHYGLALTLGGGEVSMVELAQLYAMLANRGLWRPLRRLAEEPPAPGERRLSADASFMVMDILRDNPRPDEAVWRPTRNRLTPAWKTGTSWGFRDAWTAGVFGPYVLVVWLGNFDGRSNPALVGIRSAAPLFFDLADAIRVAEPELVEPAFPQPPRLARVEVCTASGDLPNADCPQRSQTWYIPGVSPIRLSTVHRRLRIDRRSGRLACPDTPASAVVEEVYEFWPSELMRLYAQAGMPRRAPPPPGDCGLLATTAVGEAPSIRSPLAGVEYALRPEQLGQQVIPLLAHADGAVRTLYWFVDGSYLGSSAPGVAYAYRPTQTGRHQLSVSDDTGRSSARELRLRLSD